MKLVFEFQLPKMEAISYSIPSTKFHSLHTKTTRIQSSNLAFPIRTSPISIKPLYSSKFLILHHHKLRCSANHTDHNHNHTHNHNHNHNCNHNHHHHSHDIDDVNLTGPQKAIISFAKATKWIDLANFLREHLHLCCVSTALFVAAAICPHTLPKSLIKPVQNSFILIAFPLVGVSASLDALIEISGGKVNIHVLMAMAAFATIFMGNALEGGLLLAMFNLAHIAEEYFTSRSMVDVKELKENNPEFALVLDTKDNKLPNTFDLAYQRVPVHDITVGSYVLVGAGESVPVDCEVFHGGATITIEHLTGEVKPLEAKVGDRVPGGARNIDGRIILKVTKTWKESTLSKIVQLTEEAQLNRPKLQRWLDEFGERYSKVVVVLSIAIAVLGPLLFKWPFFSTPACRGSIYRALGLIGQSFESSFHGSKNSRPKVRPVSAGTVSSVIGKSYVRSTPSTSGPKVMTKPPKLDAKDLPMTGIYRETSVSKPNSSKRDQLQANMEEFLFKMLGVGFKLDRKMIREVLDMCGYDLQKVYSEIIQSLDTLLDQSVMDSDKRPAAVCDSSVKFADVKTKSEAPVSEKKSQDLNCIRGDGNIVSVKETRDIQKEVLSNLFSYREYVEEPRKRIVKDVNKKSPYGVGHVVFEPPKDTMEEHKIDMDFRRRENEDDAEDEADYQSARKAVKEYRVTMKEYYKAAVDAFANGDQAKAEKLLDQGQFYLNKAREADDECSKMILETKAEETQEMVLDLRDHEPKVAIRLLKTHLSSLSGISSFEYLKVIFDANDQANKKRSTRGMVLKLLEQESIKWVEGETAGTILIRLDNIDRNRLSFYKP